MGMEGKARNARTPDVTKNINAVTNGFACAIVSKPGNICQMVSLDRGDARQASDKKSTAAT